MLAIRATTGFDPTDEPCATRAKPDSPIPSAATNTTKRRFCLATSAATQSPSASPSTMFRLRLRITPVSATANIAPETGGQENRRHDAFAPPREPAQPTPHVVGQARERSERDPEQDLGRHEPERGNAHLREREHVDRRSDTPQNGHVRRCRSSCEHQDKYGGEGQDRELDFAPPQHQPDGRRGAESCR